MDDYTVWLTTLATQGKYLEYAKDMQKDISLAKIVGGFHIEIDDRGEGMKVHGNSRGVMGKRHAVCAAFKNHGARSVYWVDADCVVADLFYVRKVCCKLPYGIHAIKKTVALKHSEKWYDTNQRQELQDIAKWLQIDLGGSFHVCDWFLGYGIGNEPIQKIYDLVDLWGSISARLATDKIVMGDGMAIGLAASALKIPIYISLNPTDVRNAFCHKEGFVNGWADTVKHSY